MKRLPIFFLTILAAGVCCADTPADQKPERVVNTVSGATVVAFNADGSLIATAGDDGHIRLWDARVGPQATGEIQNTLRGHSGSLKAIRFLPDNKRFLSVGEDKSVKIWDLATHSEITSLDLKLADDAAIAIRPTQETQFIEAAADQIQVWDYAKGTVIKTIASTQKQESITCIAFEPAGNQFVTGNATGTIERFDLEKGSVATLQLNPPSKISSIAVSENAAAVATEDGKIWLWPKTEKTATELKGQVGEAKTIAFSRDGKLIAVPNKDMAVQIWDTTTNSIIAKLTGHSAELDSVAFNPNAQMLATCDDSGEMRYWLTPKSK